MPGQGFACLIFKIDGVLSMSHVSTRPACRPGVRVSGCPGVQVSSCSHDYARARGRAGRRVHRLWRSRSMLVTGPLFVGPRRFCFARLIILQSIEYNPLQIKHSPQFEVHSDDWVSLVGRLQFSAPTQERHVFFGPLEVLYQLAFRASVS